MHLSFMPAMPALPPPPTFSPVPLPAPHYHEGSLTQLGTVLVCLQLQVPIPGSYVAY